MERVELQCKPIIVMVNWPEALCASEELEKALDVEVGHGAELACGTCGEYGHKPADCPEQNQVRWKESRA